MIVLVTNRVSRRAQDKNSRRFECFCVPRLFDVSEKCFFFLKICNFPFDEFGVWPTGCTDLFHKMLYMCNILHPICKFIIRDSTYSMPGPFTGGPGGIGHEVGWRGNPLWVYFHIGYKILDIYIHIYIYTYGMYWSIVLFTNQLHIQVYAVKSS